jgi:hypothetical protein
LGNSTHADKFLAGSCAGVTAVAFTYPLDTIRARLAFQVTGEHIYTGIVHTAVSIFKDVCPYFVLTWDFVTLRNDNYFFIFRKVACEHCTEAFYPLFAV